MPKSAARDNGENSTDQFSMSVGDQTVSHAR